MAISTRNKCKQREQKKCVIKRKIKLEDRKNGLENNQAIKKYQQRLRSEAHIVLLEEVNKIALSSRDDKRLKIRDGATSYSYGTGVEKVCNPEPTEYTKKKNLV